MATLRQSLVVGCYGLLRTCPLSYRGIPVLLPTAAEPTWQTPDDVIQAHTHGGGEEKEGGSPAEPVAEPVRVRPDQFLQGDTQGVDDQRAHTTQRCNTRHRELTVADPGFSKREAPRPKGRQSIVWLTFPWKMYENKEIKLRGPSLICQWFSRVFA